MNIEDEVVVVVVVIARRRHEWRSAHHHGVKERRKRKYKNKTKDGIVVARVFDACSVSFSFLSAAANKTTPQKQLG